MQQLDIAFVPRTLARRENPSTSHEAAARVYEFGGEHHAKILEALREHGPGTAHEIAERCGLEAHAVGKRLNELHTRSFIGPVVDGRQKPLTRKTPSGRSAQVWYAK